MSARPPTTVAKMSAPVKARPELPLPFEAAVPAAVTTVAVMVTVLEKFAGFVPDATNVLGPKATATGVPPSMARWGSVAVAVNVAQPSLPAATVAAGVPLMVNVTVDPGANPQAWPLKLLPTATVKAPALAVGPPEPELTVVVVVVVPA
jgi:hypothetical protein